MKALGPLFPLCLLIIVSTTAFCDWEIEHLNPTWSAASQAWGVCGAEQVGYALGPSTGNEQHAVLWAGSAEHAVDLNPADCLSSYACDASNGQQVGFAYCNGYVGWTSHAGWWSGTAESWVDLNPIGCSSYASRICDGQQVGQVAGPLTEGKPHAALWKGTPESFLDLHPNGYDTSVAQGISCGQQVGEVTGPLTDGRSHAALWTGAAASLVDLNPNGWDASEAFGTSGQQQVGEAYLGGTGVHASLWSGTAASWIDLNPAGSVRSSAAAVSSGWQAGHAFIGGCAHAGAWSGAAASWVDLHKLLGADYSYSVATDIEIVGGDVWISGYARNSITGNDEAILWHNVVPEPSSLLALTTGLLALAGMIRRRNG